MTTEELIQELEKRIKAFDDAGKRGDPPSAMERYSAGFDLIGFWASNRDRVYFTISDSPLPIDVSVKIRDFRHILLLTSLSKTW